MALVPLATKGNYFHVYDFRVKPGRGDEFVDLFNKFADGVETPLFGGDGSAEGVSGLAILACERFINGVMLDNTLAQSKSGARV
jgi:hypothetical protein